MDIPLIITEQAHSIRAHWATKGTNPLAEGDVSEISLTELIDWLRTENAPTLRTSEDDIVLSHYNHAETETRRTTITCNKEDRNAIINALGQVTMISA